MDNFNPEDISRMTPQEYIGFVQRSLIDSCNSLKLLEYKMTIADTVIMYLTAKMDQNNVPMTDSDRNILDMYSKVSIANSYEIAEAHFMGVTDSFSKEAGFDSFDDLVGKIKIAASNMKEGDSFDELIRKMLAQHSPENEDNPSN